MKDYFLLTLEVKDGEMVIEIDGILTDYQWNDYWKETNKLMQKKIKDHAKG